MSAMSDSRPTSSSPIAIVALDVLLPGTPGKPGFWRDVVAARDCITDVPPSHWLIDDYYDPDPAAEDKTYCRRGGFLDPVRFDPLAFGVPPSALASTDTAQLLALVLARRVLDEASDVTGNPIDKTRTSIILGVASATELVVHLGGRLQRPNWIEGMRREGLPESQVQRIAQSIADTYVPWSEASFPGLLGNVVAGRIANRLDLGGTNYVTDAACASSLSAVQAGINELRLGEADTVIAGGVDALNDILMYMCFSKTPAFSPSGDCRPFSDKADGTILGEGLAMLALRRLEDAEADGNRIHGVIRGIGSASDGQATSVYAPKPEGQAQALRRAYQKAGYSPATVELMEAHGTGTVAGDAAEFAGLRSVFGPESEGRKGWCALGSIKSQIGHTKAAAGAAGLFKAVMALNQKVLPPTAKVDRPNPKLGIDDSPFYINSSARPWVRGSDHPRRASVSSFGFGGSNFHLTIEEYDGPGRKAGPVRLMPAELYLLSAPDMAALQTTARQTASGLNDGEGDLARLAAAAADAFDPAAAARLAIVASGLDDLADKLGSFAANPEAVPDNVHVGRGEPSGGRTAFLFPGQGSQYPGMGADLAIAFDAARQVWDEAADLGEFADGRLHDIAFPPHAFDAETVKANRERLTEMANAQPAIGAVSAAQLALLDKLGLKADAVAGHSYGEVTALFASGVFDRQSLLRIARNRGRLMTEAAGDRKGGMIALPAGRDEAVALLARSGADLVIANNNGPKQVVLSGAAEEIDRAMEFFTAEGLTPVRLPVANAFHSTIVAASVEPFRAVLEGVPMGAPTVNVFGGVTVQPYGTAAEEIRSSLAGQIARPIDFRGQVEALYDAGIRSFIEVGPASVLTGLVSQCLGERPHLALSLDRKGQNGVVAFLDALAELAARGVVMDYAWLWRDALPDAAQPAPPKHAVPIGGSNVGKPYPPVDGAAGRHAPNPEKSEVAPAAAPAAIQAKPVAATMQAAPPASSAPPADPAFHRHLAETHLAFQQSMADSHRAFLQTMERLAGGAVSDQAMQMPVPAPVEAMRPQPAAAETPAPQVMAPPPGTAAHHPPQPVAEARGQAPTFSEPSSVPSAPELPSATGATVDVAATVIELVADKTGYPADMLSLDMDLEADLGIDSIKQVEILSSLRDALPGLGEPDPGMLSEMGTLRRIVEFVEATAGSGAAAASSGDATAPVTSGPVAPAVGPDSDLLLAVVAEKTGYPVDMLSLDMELEGDLGIDSIKQVEILSAFRERYPDMPEIDPGQLAELRTLGAIVGFIGAAEGEAVGASGPASIAAESPRKTLDASILLEVVAEKTGYPSDMLSLDMELEGDLGIDSIKQVEILSSVRERFPELPEIDPGQLADLRTLGAIQDFLGGTEIAVDEPVTLTAMPAEETPRADAIRDVARWVVRPGHAPVAAGERRIPEREIVVMPSRCPLAAPLAAALAERGAAVRVADGADPGAGGLVYLGATLEDDRGDGGPESVVDAVMAASAMAPGMTVPGGLFVVIENLGGDFGLGGADDGAWGSGLAGLAGTAAKEWPGAQVKAIDIDADRRSPEDTAAALADEILYGGTETEVALSTTEGRRVPVPVAAPLIPVSGRSGLRDGMVIVASAGARGITAASLIELARHYRLKLALFGRTAFESEEAGFADARDEASLIRMLAARGGGRMKDPAALRSKARNILQGREISATLSKLEELGSEARYIAVDIREAGDVAAAVADVRASWGAVTGIVHGAGVLADRRLEDKTPEQVRAVAVTKIGGLRNLLAATAEDPLEMICLFSSAAAVAGNEGQSDYATANRMLDNIASSLQAARPDCVVKSVAWGPWDGGMVNDGLRDLFRARGIDLIPLDAGTAFLRRELEAGSTDCRVIAGSTDLGQRSGPDMPGEGEPGGVAATSHMAGVTAGD
jgi:acyl transferase domain-containing protein/NADP-dependent 3-hydroxy acid dehydrogenase YdfG